MFDDAGRSARRRQCQMRLVPFEPIEQLQAGPDRGNAGAIARSQRLFLGSSRWGACAARAKAPTSCSYTTAGYVEHVLINAEACPRNVHKYAADLDKSKDGAASTWVNGYINSFEAWAYARNAVHKWSLLLANRLAELRDVAPAAK